MTTSEARQYNNIPSDHLADFIALHYPANEYKGALHVWAKSKKKNGRIYRYCYGSPLEVLEKVRHDRATERVQDYYITANTMSAGTRDKENLFGLHNIVIDIDNHAGADPADIKRQYDAITAYYRFKNMDASGDFIPNTIVYTGRGVQLWYCIEQISYKRLDIYETITGELINQVGKLLADHPDTLEGLTLDAGASRNAAGLFRAPWSYNRKAETKAEFTILHDSYIESMEEAKRIREELKSTGKVINYRTAATKANIHALKRQRSLVNLVKLRQARGETIQRNDILLCISYIWGKICLDDMEIIEQVKSVNRIFNNPMTNKEIEQTLKTALVKRYRAKNETIIDFLGITEEEQSEISFYPGGKREKERAEKRKEKEARDKQILNLYEAGETQEDIARKLNISRRTVCNVLERNHARKCDTVTLFERDPMTDNKTDVETIQGQNEARESMTGALNEEPKTSNPKMCKNSLYVAEILPDPKKGYTIPEYMTVLNGGRAAPGSPEGSGHVGSPGKDPADAGG